MVMFLVVMASVMLFLGFLRRRFALFFRALVRSDLGRDSGRGSGLGSLGDHGLCRFCTAGRCCRGRLGDRWRGKDAKRHNRCKAELHCISPRMDALPGKRNGAMRKQLRGLQPVHAAATYCSVLRSAPLIERQGEEPNPIMVSRRRRHDQSQMLWHGSSRSWRALCRNF